MPKFDEEEFIRSSSLDEGIQKRVKNLSKLISVTKGIKISDIVDEDFNLLPRTTIIRKLGLTVARNLFNLGDLKSAIDDMRNPETRSELLAQDDTWKVLVNKSDDFIEFINNNTDVIGRLINDKLKIDSDIPNDKSVVHEDIIPLLQEIVQKAGDNPEELGKIVSHLVNSIRSSEGKNINIETIISRIFDTVDTNIQEVLIDPKNIHRIGNIISAIYESNESLRLKSSKFIKSKEELEVVKPLIIDLLKIGIADSKTRNDVALAIKVLNGSEDLTIHETTRILNLLVNKAEMLNGLIAHRSEAVELLLSNLLQIDPKNPDGSQIFERNIVREDIIPLMSDILSVAGDDHELVSENFGRIIASLKKVDGKIQKSEDFLKNLLVSASNSKLLGVFQKDENAERICNILERIHQMQALSNRDLDKRGALLSKIVEMRPVTKALIKHAIGNPKNRDLVLETVGIITNTELNIGPVIEGDKTKKLLSNLQTLLSNPELNKELNENADSRKALAATLVPILKNIKSIQDIVSKEVLDVSNELALSLVDSFLRNPEQIGRFSEIIYTNSIKDRGKAVAELFIKDDVLSQAFVKSGEDTTIHKQTVSVVSKVLHNVITIKQIEEKRETTDKFINFGVPIILEALKNAKQAGDASATSVTDILAKIDKLSSIDDSSEKRSVKNSIIDESLGLVLSEEQSSILAESIPTQVKANRYKIGTEVKKLLDKQDKLSFVEISKVMDVLEDAKALKKIANIGMNIRKKNKLKVIGGAIKLFCTSAQVRSIAGAYLKEKFKDFKKKAKPSHVERLKAQRENISWNRVVRSH